jgi:Uma2 family endonuclease
MATVIEEIPPEILPDVELAESDGEPMETSWHREAMWLLIDVVRYHLRDHKDFHVGGNNFIYYCVEEARKGEFKGPDFFYVKGVRYDPLRPYWVVWLEGGKYPDVIIELLSRKTAKIDLTTKKDVYERVFHTADYFCYDPETRKLQGWHHNGTGYQPLQPNEHGWLWCEELQLWLGTWAGEYQGCHATWLRFYGREGNLIPALGEAAAQRAEEAQQRAEAAEAEVARLKALLGEKDGPAGS